jgi:YidC/Oxa1 family membrane protein insertase
MRPTLSRKERRELFRQELSNYRKFFAPAEREHRELVFYSAQAQYYSFFEGVLAELCSRGAMIAYITSDHDDPILTDHHPNIIPHYFDALFPFILPFLDAKVVVMTMPDLNLFHIRRSIYKTNHVYMFHSLMSTHMGFRPGSLDHFDTILCAGPHHKDEIQRTENLYGLKPKLLLETGYYRLEKIYADHKRHQTEFPEGNDRPLVLIAPSGHPANITATCARQLVAALLASDFDVLFRPHPMTIYRKPEQIHALTREFNRHPRFRLDLETVSEKYLHRADVLISDWSGVALEYAFGTERPVLFVDLPVRQQNPEYHRLGIPPAEIFLRDKIGELIRVEEISRAGKLIRALLDQRAQYRENIVGLRERYLYNFGFSARFGAHQIISLLDHAITER